MHKICSIGDNSNVCLLEVTYHKCSIVGRFYNLKFSMDVEDKGQPPHYILKKSCQKVEIKERLEVKDVLSEIANTLVRHSY